MGHFVAGAPAFMTSNINPLRGLANGTSAKLYSLEPSAILVKLILQNDVLSSWADECTCITGSVVVSVEMKKKKSTLGVAMLTSQ